MLERHRWALRRAIVRGGRGRFRPLWRGAHELVVRGLLACLTRGLSGASSYARGSLSRDDIEIGLSDLDLAVVLADEAGASGELVRERWQRIGRRLPVLDRHVHLAVYEQSELRRVLEDSALTAAEPCYFGTTTAPDGAGLRHRPGLYGRAEGWRRLAGPERRPSPLRPGHEHRMAAWLELQFWWRLALALCGRPDDPTAAHACVKLLGEASRIWLWVGADERAGSRRECLQEALGGLADVETPFRLALDLERDLGRSPAAPIAEILPGFVRISRTIVRLLFPDDGAHSPTRVTLAGAEPPVLALPAGATEGLAALAPGSPVLPLVDWHGVVVSPRPDEAMIRVDADPGSPDAIGRILAASKNGACVGAIHRDDLLVVAFPGGGSIHRPLQCEATDPVSFALLSSEPEARFPRSAGLSASDWARRAVVEHRAWLTTDPDAEAPTLRSLGRHLTAARAALFAESLDEGAPRLAVTVAAAADELRSRLPFERTAIDEAAGRYARCRSNSTEPSVDVVQALRRAVLRLPAYGGAADTTRARSSR